MIAPEPIKVDKIWGYESWIASVYKDAPQKDFLSAAGKDFPLLVKIIQADERLSVQVHPDDENALRLEGKGFRGKTECWYILDAEEGASLVCGLKKDYGREELFTAIKENRLEEYLNIIPVKKGDFVYIPAGTVHAIGGGFKILEVQQSSDITYRLYDWGRPRELHIEKALASLKFDEIHTEKPFTGRFDCRYFSLEILKIAGKTELVMQDTTSSKMQQLLFVINGSGSAISESDGAMLELAPDRLIAVSPEEKLILSGKLDIMKICCTTGDSETFA